MLLIDTKVVARALRAAARAAEGQARIVLFALAEDFENLIATEETAAN